MAKHCRRCQGIKTSDQWESRSLCDFCKEEVEINSMRVDDKETFSWEKE